MGSWKEWVGLGRGSLLWLVGVWFSRGRGFEGGKWVGWGTFLKELSWFFYAFF